MYDFCFFVSFFYENVHTFCSVCHHVGDDISKLKLGEKKIEKPAALKISIDKHSCKTAYVPKLHAGSGRTYSFKEDAIVTATVNVSFTLK